ncbi:MAG: trigger factor [Bacilli bacterium]
MNIKKINDSKTEITVKVEKTEWEEALNQSFNKIIKDVKIDGFRKGKAPRNVYEQKHGKEKIYMDAVDSLLQGVYTKVLKETKLIPVVQPIFELKDVSDKGVTYIITIITNPTVTIEKYKGLGIKKEEVKVTKKEIKEEIENIKKQYAEIEIKESPIEIGDIAVIDFEGFKDGISFEGGKGENYPLEIGSNAFIPGFEDQLIGLRANAKKEVEVTFPDEYHSEDLKGKKVTFKVEIKEVKRKVIPEINKEFFEDLGMEGISDLKSLEKDVEDRIKAKKEVSNENVYIDNLLKEVATNTKVEIPEEITEEEIKRMIGQFSEQLKLQGMGLDQYYQMTNTKEEDIKKHMKPEAENRVKYRLILEKIAELEDIKITDKDAQKEADKLAERYQMETEEFLKMFGGIEMIKYDLKMRKAMETLKE